MDKETLHRYFAGKSTSEEEVHIVNWVEQSEANRKIYLKERMLWDAVTVNCDPQNIPASTTIRSLHTNVWRTIAVAASIALLLGISWTVWDRSEDKILQQQTVIVPAGQRVQLVLADGTKVWLNSKTTFTYPATFSDKNREVTLNGEAYFEVKKDAEHPFLVKTNTYDIQVFGTTFNVYAYDNADYFETSLINGSVLVRSDKYQLKLQPGEVASGTSNILNKGKISNLDEFRWKDGLLCFDDEPMGALMKKFSIYYDINIQIANPGLLSYRCTGKFRHNDGIEYALKVIQKDLKFSFNRDDESNTIILK